MVVKIHQIKNSIYREMHNAPVLPHSEVGINCLMSFFNEGGIYRECIKIKANNVAPESAIDSIINHGNNNNTLLDRLERSISSGDVISLDEKNYLILPVGYIEIN